MSRATMNSTMVSAASVDDASTGFVGVVELSLYYRDGDNIN